MIDLLITLVILGLIWWVVESVIPMAEPFRTIARVVLALILILYLLSLIGYATWPPLLRR